MAIIKDTRQDKISCVGCIRDGILCGYHEGGICHEENHYEAAKPQEWIPINRYVKPLDCKDEIDLVLLFEPHSMGGFSFVGAINMDGEWTNNLDLKKQNPTHFCRSIPENPALLDLAVQKPLHSDQVS